MKFFVYLFTLLLFSEMCLANNFSWKKSATTNDDSSTWYYDKNTIAKVGSYNFAWVMADYHKPEGEDISAISYMMIHCDSYEMKWISYTGYSKSMGKGRVTDEFIIPEEDLSYFKWEYFDPKNTTLGVVLKKICN